IARIAANERWSRCPDRKAALAAANKAREDRFTRQVDPDNKLDPAERARRAENARRAFYIRLSRAGVRARTNDNRQAGQGQHGGYPEVRHAGRVSAVEPACPLELLGRRGVGPIRAVSVF